MYVRGSIGGEDCPDSGEWWYLDRELGEEQESKHVICTIGHICNGRICVVRLFIENELQLVLHLEGGEELLLVLHLDTIELKLLPLATK